MTDDEKFDAEIADLLDEPTHKLTVVTLYRTDDEHTVEQIDDLVSAVRRHYGKPVTVVCFTNDDELLASGRSGVEVVRLAHSWPGQWSVMELFRSPWSDKRTVAIELGTFIDDGFALVDEYLAQAGGDVIVDRRRVSTTFGMMAWSTNKHCVYEAFVADVRIGEFTQGHTKRFSADGFTYLHELEWIIPTVKQFQKRARCWTSFPIKEGPC